MPRWHAQSDTFDAQLACFSCVDLAVGTVQHIPTVEAFLEAGARPSEQALQRGTAGTPIMR